MNIEMVYHLYYIRRIADGAVFPHREGGGKSHDEPSIRALPRLFHSRASATNALIQWCRGRHVKRSESESWEIPIRYSYIEIEHDPSRRKQDFEVVELIATHA